MKYYIHVYGNYCNAICRFSRKGRGGEGDFTTSFLLLEKRVLFEREGSIEDLKASTTTV